MKDLNKMTYKGLWHYSLKLKEGSCAWLRVMLHMRHLLINKLKR